MQTQYLTPENYVLRLGKYKNMRAVDVAEIYEVDKNGDDQPKGLQYLQWLIQQDWFRHKDIIEHIIKNAVDCISGDDKTLQRRSTFKAEAENKKEPEQPKIVEVKQKREK